MAKDGKQGLVPKLRFPGFRDGKGWDADKVADKTTSFTGGTPSTSAKKYYDGRIPFIRSGEIGKEATELSLTEVGLNSSAAKLITRGDVLVALYGANSGEVALAKIDGAINQAILCLRSVDNNSFLYQYLSARKDWITATYLQGGQGNLSGDIVKSIVLGFPNQAEQRKIADCLTSLDTLIAAQEKKLELLKVHKKGLMQQLFSQTAPPRINLPLRRFPEFRTQPYRAARLQDVTEECTTRNGDSLSLDSVMGVTKLEGIVPMKERLIANDITRYKLVRKNWFAYNPMRLNIGSIARWPNESDVLVSPDYVVFRCLEEPDSEIDPEYLDQFRRSEQWQDFVTESGDGSVRIRIYYKDIARLELNLPPLAEQQRIGECLASLDDQITAESAKRNALKLHKQGLMQQLFPMADAAV